MTHYRAFIEVAKGLGTTQEDLQQADSQLDALLADLPALSAACEHFAKCTAAFTARRADSKQLLSASTSTPCIFAWPGPICMVTMAAMTDCRPTAGMPASVE